MKLSRIGALVLLAAIGVGAWVIYPKCFGAKLKISPLTLDLGNVWDDEKVIKTVTLKNSSWKTITIEDVHSDCGCTVPSLPVSELKSGESVPMLVEFHAPVLYQAEEDAKTVTIKTSEGIFKLPVKASVRPRVEISASGPNPVGGILPEKKITKPLFDFGALSKAEEIWYVIIFRNNNGNQPWTPKVTAKPAGMNVELKTVSAAQFELEVKITKTAMLDGAWLEEPVTVDLGNEHTIPVLFNGSRQSDVVVEPPTINFGMVQPNQSKQLSATITHQTLGDKFKIKGVQNATPSLKTNLKQVAPGQYVLTATWSGDKNTEEGKVQKMTLSLETNDTEQPRIILPLLGMVPKTSTGCCGNDKSNGEIK